MSLFGFKKKSEGDTHGNNRDAAVKILGSGCAKCNELEQNTKNALVQLGMSDDIDHVTDFAQIAAYGVMATPAIVLNGKVLAYGKVLKANEIVALLQKEI